MGRPGRRSLPLHRPHRHHRLRRLHRPRRRSPQSHQYPVHLAAHRQLPRRPRQTPHLPLRRPGTFQLQHRPSRRAGLQPRHHPQHARRLHRPLPRRWRRRRSHAGPEHHDRTQHVRSELPASQNWRHQHGRTSRRLPPHHHPHARRPRHLRHERRRCPQRSLRHGTKPRRQHQRPDGPLRRCLSRRRPAPR